MLLMLAGAWRVIGVRPYLAGFAVLLMVASGVK
jgi:hypothetical protein